MQTGIFATPRTYFLKEAVHRTQVIVEVPQMLKIVQVTTIVPNTMAVRLLVAFGSNLLSILELNYIYLLVGALCTG